MADEYVMRAYDLHVHAETVKQLLLSSPDPSVEDAMLHVACAVAHRHALALRPSLPLFAAAYASNLLGIVVDVSVVWAVFPMCKIRLHVEQRPSSLEVGKFARTRDWLVLLVLQQDGFRGLFSLELLDLQTGRWHELPPQRELYMADVAASSDSNIFAITTYDCKEGESYCATVNLDLRLDVEWRWHPVAESGLALVSEAGTGGFIILDVGKRTDSGCWDPCCIPATTIDANGNIQTIEIRALALPFVPMNEPCHVKLVHGRLCAISPEDEYGGPSTCVDLDTSEILCQGVHGLRFSERGLVRAHDSRECAVFDFAARKFGPSQKLVEITLP
jgi:hypothetical protein